MQDASMHKKSNWQSTAIEFYRIVSEDYRTIAIQGEGTGYMKENQIASFNFSPNCLEYFSAPFRVR